jgi:hypothetical protein
VENHQGIPEQTMVVILAAGKGTRMGREDLVKVCFEIDGVPAINRLNPDFVLAHFCRGNAYKRRGESDKGIGDTTTAQELANRGRRQRFPF